MMTRKRAEPRDPNDPRTRLHRLGLYGLIARWPEVAEQPWIGQLLDIEESEHKQRSLDRRLRYAKIGAFKPMDRFDWAWPTKIDRQAIDELFSLSFIDEAENAILLGPNGVGKSMILKNIRSPRIGTGPHRPIHHRQRHVGRPRCPRQPIGSSAAHAPLGNAQDSLH